MGACVTVDVKEIERLSKKLNSYSLSSAERKSLMVSLGVEIEEQTKDRFYSTQTDPDGKQWADFAAVTRNYLIRKGFAGTARLLNRTGNLARTIKGYANEWQVIVGSVCEYASTHQFGAKQGAFGRTSNNVPIPWGDIPARPFFGLSTDDISDLEEMTESWLRSHIK